MHKIQIVAARFSRPILAARLFFKKWENDETPLFMRVLAVFCRRPKKYQ